MRTINFNNNIKTNDLNNYIEFDIDPLDINLAKIQFNFKSRCEKEIVDNKEFPPIYEKYESKDPSLDLAEINVICKYSKDIINLDILVTNKTKTHQYEYTLVSGTKHDILKYLDSTLFFTNTKNFINLVLKN